jgi:hypothetical protein
MSMVNTPVHSLPQTFPRAARRSARLALLRVDLVVPERIGR